MTLIPQGEIRSIGSIRKDVCIRRSLITTALVGSSAGETDVADLLKNGFQTSAYNFKAIVNTAEKVNWDISTAVVNSAPSTDGESWLEKEIKEFP